MYFARIIDLKLFELESYMNQREYRKHLLTTSPTRPTIASSPSLYSRTWSLHWWVVCSGKIIFKTKYDSRDKTETKLHTFPWCCWGTSPGYYQQSYPHGCRKLENQEWRLEKKWNIYIYIQKTHAWFKNPKLYTVNLEWEIIFFCHGCKNVHNYVLKKIWFNC